MANIKAFCEMIYESYKVKLEDVAYKKEVIDDVIDRFGALNYSKLKQRVGKYIYLNMLYELYQNKDYSSMKKIDEGIEKLYNSNCIKNEDKYANALFCIAKVIHKNKDLDDIMINGVLEIIASLGDVCITGQRRGIIKLIFEFRYEIKDFLKDKIELPQKIKPIQRVLDEIFFEARVKVANKLMNEFYIKRRNRNFTDPHMEDFFKKCLNEIYNFNIPIMSEADPLGFNVEARDVLGFLRSVNIESLILDEVIFDIKARCSDDPGFYNMILDFGFWYFHENSIKEDISTFLSNHVFVGESKDLRTGIVYEILEHEGYIKNRSKVLDDIIKSDVLSKEIKIISNNTDILSVKNQDDITLQEYLLMSKDLDALKLLYDADCIDLDIKNNLGDTLLVKAVKLGFFDISKLFICWGANLKDRDRYGNTLLMIACENDDIKMSRLLIENNADLEERDICNETVLIHACKAEKVEIVRLLLENKACVNVRSRDEYTVLMFNYKNISIPKLLIEHGANVNEKGRCDLTPLMRACELLNFDMVKLLIQNNANINEKGRCNQTALMYACEFKAKDIVEYLINKGANINDKANGGATALIFAFFTCIKDEQKNFEIVKLLLEHGADVNIKGEYGSPILYACKYWNAKVLKLLIEYGANVYEKDYNGKTLLSLSYERGDKDIINMLKKYEKKVSVVSDVTLERERNIFLG